MSAANYKLTLSGENRVSKVLKGAAADAGYLTKAFKEQDKAAAALNRTQRNLGSYSALRTGMKDTRHELEKTEKQIEQLGQQSKASAANVERLAAEQRKAKQEVQRWDRAISKAGVPTEKLIAQQRKVKNNLDSTSQALAKERAQLKGLKEDLTAATLKGKGLEKSANRQQNELSSLSSELRGSGVNLRQFSSEQQRLERETKAANLALDQQKNRLKAVAQARNRVSAADSRMANAQGDIMGTTAMVLGAAIPISRAITMEAAMANVAEVTNFEGDEQAKLKSQLGRLAVDVNMAPEELTEIAATAGQSGIKKEELINFTGDAARMGVAFDMSASDSGETLAAWRDSMGLDSGQSLKLMDAVNHVGNNMGGRAREISGVLKRQGATATASGLTPEQSAGLAGAILSSKQGEEISATAMKNLLGSLTGGDATAKGKREALATLGFNTTDLARDMQRDGAGTIQSVFDRLAREDRDKQIGLIKEIIGEDSVGAIVPLLKNPALLKKAFGLVDNPAVYKGSAQQEYLKQSQTTAHRLGSAWKAIDHLGMVLGENLLPVIGPVADGVKEAAEWLANLAEKNKTFAAGLTLAAASFVGYKVAQTSWRLISAKSEQLRGNSALKTAAKEARLASKTKETGIQAGRATIALGRLNRALERTGRGRGAAYSGGYGGHDYGDFDLDNDRNKNKNNKAYKKGSKGAKKGKFARLGQGLQQLMGKGNAAKTRSKPSNTQYSKSWSPKQFNHPVAPPLNLPKSTSKTSFKKVPSNTAIPAVNNTQPLITGSGSGGVKGAVKGAVVTGAIAAASNGNAGVIDGIESAVETSADMTQRITDVTAETTETAADMTQRATGAAVKFAKVIRPVATIMDAVQLGDAVASGDTKAISETTGEIAGGTGGAWAGATGGAALGTVILPGIGTAIGAALGGIAGGIAGSEAGEWLGGVFAESWFGDDETGSALKKAQQARDAQQEKVNEIMQSNKIDLSAVINIQLPLEANAQNIGNIVKQTLKDSMDQTIAPLVKNSLQDSIENDMTIAP